MNPILNRFILQENNLKIMIELEYNKRRASSYEF